MHSVSFFGQPSVYQNDIPKTIKSKRALGLLAVVHHHGRINRADLQKRLWSGDADDDVYARRLRVLLYSMKKYSGDFLTINSSTISWKHNPDRLTDTQKFEKLVGEVNVDSYKLAVDLYKGEFMAGLRISQADAFEDWLDQQRIFWTDRVSYVFESIVNSCLQGRRKSDLDEAMHYAHRSIALNPWRDESQMQLAIIYLKKRQPDLATKLLERHIDRVERQMQLEATPDIFAMHSLISDGQHDTVIKKFAPEFLGAELGLRNQRSD